MSRAARDSTSQDGAAISRVGSRSAFEQIETNDCIKCVGGELIERGGDSGGSGGRGTGGGGAGGRFVRPIRFQKFTKQAQRRSRRHREHFGLNSLDFFAPSPPSSLCPLLHQRVGIALLL